MGGTKSGVGWLVVAVMGVTSACSLGGGGDDADPPPDATPIPADGTLSILFDEPLAEISPLILGISGPIDEFTGAGVTFNSWGGTRSTRYNYQLGNAWNLGRDGAFRNEGSSASGDVVGDWLAANEAADVVSRVAVPGLGWIARDGDPETCSFPDETDEGCLAAISFDCASTGPIADPRRANVGSSPVTVGEWIGGYVDDGIEIPYLAVDNEPERWGIDHYDVHPTCSDYFEILGTYVAYAEALRSSSRQSQLTGPVMCCWYEYLDPPGPDESSDEALLPWFLRELSERDPDGPPLIDVVDVHFRPQADVVNSRDDDGLGEQRVEAARELWDPTHELEALDGEAVEFIPRLRRTIDEFFPDMPLMISDWRFGGETTMSGALAISQALGVFAREGVHAAAYADGGIGAGTPAYFAFKLFGNYDDRGGSFRGTAVATAGDGIDGLDGVDAYAAVDAAGILRIVIVNGSAEPRRVDVDLGEIETTRSSSLYTYSPEAPDEIVRSQPFLGEASILDVAAASVSMLEIGLAGEVDVSTDEAEQN